MQPVLERLCVDLLEQPLPADADDALLGFSSCIPICADEACHVTADLPRLRDRYQAVNIKLDKTGVERVMGFCTEAEYESFMTNVPLFEDLQDFADGRALQMLCRSEEHTSEL